MTSQALTSVFIGSDTLLIECGDTWRAQGHSIAAVVTSARRVSSWARAHGITVIDAEGDYVAALASTSFDYLFAVTHLAIIPDAMLSLPKRAAINFHDGPLPKYAGLNAPTWALINREHSYGITWHTMTAKIDGGDLLKQVSLEISGDETSLSLNTRCFALAIESFGELVKELASGTERRLPQPTEGRSYFGRHARPAAACVIDWSAPATTTAALIRALDFGPRYPNTLGAAMLHARGRALVVTAAEALPEQAGEPGTVVAADAQRITIACGEGALAIASLRDLTGVEIALPSALAVLGLNVGDRLDQLTAAERDALTTADKVLAKSESFWTQRLLTLDPVELPYAHSGSAHEPPAYRDKSLSVPEAFARAFPGESALSAAFAIYLGRLGDKTQVALAYTDKALTDATSSAAPFVANVVPLVIQTEPAPSFTDVIARFDAERDAARKRGAYLRNLGARYPELLGTAALVDPALLPVGVACGVLHAAGSSVQLHVDGAGARLRFDPARVDEPAATRMAAELSDLLSNLAASPSLAVERVELLSPEARQRQLITWNQTEAALPPVPCIHALIEAQVDRTPDAVAVACEDASLTYRQLDEAANRLAAHLRALGVKPEQPVGIHIERSIHLVVATLGVLKAGGAYVPLDPTYPTDRIALMIEDAHLKVVVTQQSLVAGLAAYGVTPIALDAEANTLALLSPARPERNVGPENLAYLIYTSGSTGRPKGVMLEHRHAVNFFVGMDARVAKDPPGTWLAVTSLSFDISVLELLWTLARGFKVVVHADRARAAATSSRHARKTASTRLEFSLFYFSADAAAEGSERYRLLLEGARFADENGFSAVWTPERHFHAFGGLYPNPAVTGAAIAAITKKVGVRAGSVVLPLHHPVRVVEAWSIVDNISNGRVGISVASGWQPNDFILMPENFKTAKSVMMRDLEVVRRLWRGETVSFPGYDGKPVPVQTQPTPVQKELPVWITTAGNAETFEMAGKAGANVLTHLLGQSLDKLAPKIDAYRRARAAAGFDPNTGIVSLMLHTFVGPDRAKAKELARDPLKAYLSTSMDLIKDKAWAFPAFAKARAEKAGEGDELSSLTAEEREGMLDFAFERYFETSGLFGTIEDALGTLQKLKAIGVDDVACLIDFGIATQVVLDHLPYLNEVRAAEQSTSGDATNELEPARNQSLEHPFLTDVREHAVTHMQCTPSMARMFLGHEETRAALGKIKHVFLGGEALPNDLIQELRGASQATITNMYGPTETTVWSTTYAVKGDESSIPIGTPIANTVLYVLDSQQRPVPVGVMGELWIGGLGVARGYWEREELTRERFTSDPFSSQAGARMYRTGDRARFRADGVMEFFGRADFQVKVRGYRIEPGEIEARVRKSVLVAECVVILREDRPGDQRLVGYVVPAPGAKLDATAIREGLRAELPEYMVPSSIVIIDELPLTPNRKIDRKALPLPEQQIAAIPAGAGPKPESEVQQKIATVWHDVLARDGIGLDDNFFDLGGHSLLVVRAHRKLQESLSRPLALTDLYRFPTIRSLSGFLEDGSSGDSRKASERGARRRELLQRRGR